MNKLKRYTKFLIVITITFFLMPLDSEGSKKDPARQKEVSAMQKLGISGIACNCTFSESDDEKFWFFRTEPEILDIEENSPAFEKLEVGDIIIAIDGKLITTRQAGIQFANLISDVEVEFQIRRDGKIYTVSVTPDENWNPSDNQVSESYSLSLQKDSEALTELSLSIEKLSKSLSRLESSSSDSDPKNDITRLSEWLEFNSLTPKGWLGFGLSMNGSIQRKENNEPALWTFDESPRIKSIEPNSPADKAGMKENDIIIEINGKRLDTKEGGKIFSTIEPGQKITWTIERGDKTLIVYTISDNQSQIKKRKKYSSSSKSNYPIRYTGVFGDTEIEVRGSRNVKVEVNEETNETFILSEDSVIRFKKKN